MRRNTELIFKLLTYVEKHTNGPVTVPSFDDYGTQQVHNHVRLAVEAGYIEADDPAMYEFWVYPAIQRLTWSGHEVLDRMRSERRS